MERLFNIFVLFWMIIQIYDFNNNNRNYTINKERTLHEQENITMELNDIFKRLNFDLFIC